jgi:anti-sigma-K factor RskA
MSGAGAGSGAPEDPEDPDGIVVRAGEFVLGLLSPEAAQALLGGEASGDAAMAEAVSDWQVLLAPLLAAVEPVNPPPALWTALERAAFGPDAVPRSGRRPGRGVGLGVGVGAGTGVGAGGAIRRAVLWRRTAIGFAVAAGVAGLALLSSGPGRQPVPVAVLLPTTQGAPVIVASALGDGRLSLHPLHPLSVPPGRDLELWSLPAGATRPVALGVLPATGLVLAADRVPVESGQILVSLEPRGGSPTGQPTGPVLWGGVVR